MRQLVVAVLIFLIAVPAGAATKLKTEEQKTLYGVGLVIARQLATFNLTPKELKVVQQGIVDGVTGKKPRVDFATYSKKSQELGIARRDAYGKKLEARAKEYLETAAKMAGAVKTKSGAIYLSLLEGKGTPPGEVDRVRLNYLSTLIDGREIESTYKQGEPAEAPLNEFFSCLTEGVQLIKPGGKARLVCPPETILGQKGVGVIPPNATMVFEVELLEMKTAEEPHVH